MKQNLECSNKTNIIIMLTVQKVFKLRGMVISGKLTPDLVAFINRGNNSFQPLLNQIGELRAAPDSPAPCRPNTPTKN